MAFVELVLVRLEESLILVLETATRSWREKTRRLRVAEAVQAKRQGCKFHTKAIQSEQGYF